MILRYLESVGSDPVRACLNWQILPCNLDLARHRHCEHAGDLSEVCLRDTTVLLVHPPQRGLLEGFSSGLISLANFLTAHEPSADVRLLDLGLSESDDLAMEIAQAARRSRKRLFVGITTTTASYQSALAVARLFKNARCDSIIITGGHHVSTQDDVVLRRHALFLDIVVRGEGEMSLLELVRRHPSLDGVPGISYIENGTLQRNAPACLLGERELDSIAGIALIPGLRSAPGKFEHLTYVSARGCPLKCSFCSVSQQTIRAKSVSGVISDLRYIVGDLGYERIAIEDNFFAHSPKRTLDLCNALSHLRTEMNFTWDCQTRVESMQDPLIVKAMENAGCEAVYLGVESVVADQLLYLGKTLNPERYLRVLEHRVLPKLMSSKIAIYLNLQVGLPGESGIDRRQTLSFIERLGSKARAVGTRLTLFPQLNVIYPGTKHYYTACSEGLFARFGDEVFEAFTEWELQQEPILRWLGRHFAHGTGGIPIGVLNRDALRSSGEFWIDGNSVAAISEFLDDLELLPGISVFNYKQYLTPTSAPLPRRSEQQAQGLL
jgi:radical SAM superfamily enzyme YgiQ (UPF0313 family)